MLIEKISIKTATVFIFLMLGVVAIILSLLAGSYFRQAALDAQVNSLSRVIEVASQEALREVSKHTSNLGMKLGHSKQLLEAVRDSNNESSRNSIVSLLDDPLITGFVGFSKINLVKLRIYSLDLELIAESRAGLSGIDPHLPEYMASKLIKRRKSERLKAIDALWLSSKGPLFSTLMPLGGLRAVGYLEVVADPSFNLSEAGKITKTPIRVIAATDQLAEIETDSDQKNHLPVSYLLHASDGKPAFKIVSLEDISALNTALSRTQTVTISGFLLLAFSTLLFALWLFKRFLFIPLDRIVENMQQIAQGRLDLAVNSEGLKEFSTFADSFDVMVDQVKARTYDLERLLDLDNSSILCFRQDGGALYFNKEAMALFGYGSDEISDLELDDLFSAEAMELITGESTDNVVLQDGSIHVRLSCIHNNGSQFQSDAIINASVSRGGIGYTLVINPITKENENGLTSYVENTEKRMLAVEQSINTILEITRNNPGLRSDITTTDQSETVVKTEDEKQLKREQVVRVMHSALACWEHVLGKSKLDLAEESGIWQVYIDKSTPTTRTLDKYLQIESCPKNPRNQRVIDTAEFVLRNTQNSTSEYRQTLKDELELFRLSISGV